MFFRIRGRVHPGFILSSVCLHRLSFSTIDSTVAVDTKGFGSAFQAARNSSIAFSRSSTLIKTPRRMRLLVSSPNQRSTRFNQRAQNPKVRFGVRGLRTASSAHPPFIQERRKRILCRHWGWASAARTRSCRGESPDDAAVEPDESVVVHVVCPTSANRQDADGKPFTVYYPGYEIADVDGQLNWVLTAPSYVPGETPSTTVVIQDNDSIRPTLTANLVDSGSLQLVLKGQVGSTLVLETRTGIQPWIPVQTNLLQNTDTVIALLPLGPQSHALYRALPR